jgi:hypothetical protein
MKCDAFLLTRRYSYDYFMDVLYHGSATISIMTTDKQDSICEYGIESISHDHYY